MNGNAKTGALSTELAVFMAELKMPRYRIQEVVFVDRYRHYENSQEFCNFAG